MKKTLYQAVNYLLNKQSILSFVAPFLSERKQEKIMIASLRSELSFWGFDTSDMSDEEIKQGMKRSAQIMAQCGVTADECARALRLLTFTSPTSAK